jgi:hypothetical protein
MHGGSVNFNFRQKILVQVKEQSGDTFCSSSRRGQKGRYICPRGGCSALPFRCRPSRMSRTR